MIKTIKVFFFKILGLTIVDPLDKEFPRLPSGKYGEYVCEVCKVKKAERWQECSKTKFCVECALKYKNLI